MHLLELVTIVIDKKAPVPLETDNNNNNTREVSQKTCSLGLATQQFLTNMDASFSHEAASSIVPLQFQKLKYKTRYDFANQIPTYGSKKKKQEQKRYVVRN